MREPGPSDAPALQALWAASQDADNPALRPHTGWWSLTAWATTARLLLADGEPIGVAALDAATGDAAVARLALVPAYRQPAATGLLVATTLDLARAAGVARVAGVAGVRLDIPAVAPWASEQARARGFHPIRTVHVMLLPADAPFPAARAVVGAHLRPLRPDEEPARLAALKRAWGALLAAGVAHLRRAGADAVALGVADAVALGVADADPAPIALYRSAGFATIDTVDTLGARRARRAPGLARPRVRLDRAGGVRVYSLYTPTQGVWV